MGRGKKQIIMDANTKMRYRLALAIAIVAACIGIVWCYLWQLESRLPKSMILYQDRMEQIDLGLPLVGEIKAEPGGFLVNGNQRSEAEAVSFSLDHKISLKADRVGSYQADLKLFGLIPYKKMQVDVIQEQKVMPSGSAVGIYLESQGIMVLGTTEVRGKDGFIHHPTQDILQEGDYLLSVNNHPAESIQKVTDLIQENRDRKITVELQRGNNRIKVKVEPVCSDEGIYQIGAWLREDTEGIGTMTCVTENNHFVALGHGITDVDTGELIHLSQGGLYPASIQRIIAGRKGTPGELFGSVVLSEEQKLGNVTENNIWGISGKMEHDAYQYQEDKGIPIALKQEIQTGAASILCQLDNGVREYQIKIEEINLSAKDLKGLVLQVTDPELKKKTGGIVQGLSGSPILQNGKLIGAVTHVFVNDPTRGYGIFIEHML